MFGRLIAGLLLALLAIGGFKLGLHSEQLRPPYEAIAWFFGGLGTIIGTFGGLAVVYDLFTRSTNDWMDD